MTGRSQKERSAQTTCACNMDVIKKHATRTMITYYNSILGLVYQFLLLRVICVLAFPQNIQFLDLQEKLAWL